MVWTIPACAVTLTAVAMVTAAATPASARRIAESTIKKECRAANNGIYETWSDTSGGRTVRYSACTYRDIGGTWYTDYYANGEYYNTI